MIRPQKNDVIHNTRSIEGPNVMEDRTTYDHKKVAQKIWQSLDSGFLRYAYGQIFIAMLQLFDCCRRSDNLVVKLRVIVSRTDWKFIELLTETRPRRSITHARPTCGQ